MIVEWPKVNLILSNLSLGKECNQTNASCTTQARLKLSRLSFASQAWRGSEPNTPVKSLTCPSFYLPLCNYIKIWPDITLYQNCKQEVKSLVGIVCSPWTILKTRNVLFSMFVYTYWICIPVCPGGTFDNFCFATIQHTNKFCSINQPFQVYMVLCCAPFFKAYSLCPKL